MKNKNKSGKLDSLRDDAPATSAEDSPTSAYWVYRGTTGPEIADDIEDSGYQPTHTGPAGYYVEGQDFLLLHPGLNIIDADTAKAYKSHKVIAALFDAGHIRCTDENMKHFGGISERMQLARESTNADALAWMLERENGRLANAPRKDRRNDKLCETLARRTKIARKKRPQNFGRAMATAQASATTETPQAEFNRLERSNSMAG